MAQLRCALVVCLAATLGLLVAQAPTVGEGSPSSAVLALYLQAFLRNDFSLSVLLPPRNKVRRVGPGYVQDFNDIDTVRNHTFSLVKPDSQEAVYQMCCQILALHGVVGGFTAQIGFPIGDPIPDVRSAVDLSSGVQQNFEGGHALVLHNTGTYAGQAFFIREPYVSKWRVTPALGFPIGQERNTTSRFSTTGVQQDFQGGTIVRITSGARDGQVYVVSGLIFQRYAELAQGASFLGYPIGDETTVAGRQQQNFEGGLVEYVAGQGGATARAPVSSVVIDANPVNLQVGNVITRTVTVFDNLAGQLTGRPVSWSTSNRLVVTLEASGAAATLRAVGPGFANIQAVVDGVSSGVLRITVTSSCCLVGEGAPTALIRQAFQDAVARNGITPRLPTENPVRRLGSGYVQEFTALTPAALGRFLVVKSDVAGLAFVVSGERLTRHAQLGGVVGPLGFAVSDANAAGRQLFENNHALAGTLLVAAPITQKWAALGYESGVAGLPRGEASPPGVSIFGSAVVVQMFSNGGFIYGHLSGPRAGQAYLAGGLIRSHYEDLGGPGGALGLPISDAVAAGGRTTQNFEGGLIEHLAGASQAQEILSARRPAVTAIPSQAGAGSRVRIAISGFAAGRTLRVSLTAQPDFEVATRGGAFSWDLWIRPGTPPGSYRVTARDPSTGETAEGSYRVRSVEEVRLQLTKVSGDNQVALPASEAALPLVARVTDEAGVPIAGARVRFSAFAPAVALPPEVPTDAGGYAQARLRLPPSTGLVLATAETSGRVVTFAARSEDGRLTGFPTFRQAIDDIPLGNGTASIHKKGSLLTAVAALFRYHQDRAELPAPSGLADPASLNLFLRAGGFLPFTLNGRPEQVINLSRALQFVSGAAEFEMVATTPEAIRDSVNLGRPVLLGLMLRSGNTDRGAHYVVSTGVGPDGAILLYDPSPDWNRSILADYLSGFAALGRTWTATLLHGLRLRLEPPALPRFLVHAPSSVSLDVQSASPLAGYRLRIPALAAFDELAADSGDAAQLWLVEGRDREYQLATGAAGAGVRGQAVFDPLDRGVYRIQIDAASLTVTPQTLSLAAASLSNAASFRAETSPGTLASLFGSGLAEGAATPSRLPLPESLGGLRVTVGGVPARMLFTSPFQANLQVPFGLAPGRHPVEVSSPFGAQRFDMMLLEAAPGIFRVGAGSAVLNGDGTLNTPLNPARRGGVLQVFATGLGRVAPPVETGAAAPSSPLARTDAVVTATLAGVPCQVLFAGLAPGFAGLYQVNLVIPPLLAPGAALDLVLTAAGAPSNPAPIAVE